MKLIIRIFLTSLVFAASAFAQADPPQQPQQTQEAQQVQLAVFKKEVVPLQAAVDDAVASVIPGPAGITAKSKATYLDGYGVVVVLEVMLEANRNPFSSPKTPSEIRASVTQRRKVVEEKLKTFLKERVQKMQWLGDADSLSVAVQLFNSNPADVPDLPSQLVLTIKKQDAAEVVVREF